MAAPVEVEQHVPEARFPIPTPPYFELELSPVLTSTLSLQFSQCTVSHISGESLALTGRRNRPLAG